MQTNDLKAILQDDIVVADINSLNANDYNPNEMHSDIYESLKHGIKDDGFLTPVLVQKNTNIIIDGEHRWRAAKDLGMDRILVQYIDVDEYNAKRLTIAMNERKGHNNETSMAAILKELQGQMPSMNHLDFGLKKNKFNQLTKKPSIDEENALKDMAMEDGFFIILECDSEEERILLFNQLTEEGIKCKAIK